SFFERNVLVGTADLIPMRFRAIPASLTFLAFTAACGSFGEQTPPVDTPETYPPDSPASSELVTVPPPREDIPASESSETFGVCVGAAAPDGADGSRSKPYATIAEATAAAKASGRRVYVCAGTFKESLTIERGISMVGGFDCATWEKTDGRTIVEAP